MDILLTVLRLSHIIFGIVWVGLSIVGAWVVNPVADKMGEKGDSLLRIFYGYSSYNKIFPVAAIVTTLAGIALWGLRADGAQLLGFTVVGSGVMGVGAIFGILAFGHGAAATGRFAAAYAKLARAIEEGDAGKVQEEMMTTRKKLFTHVNVSAILSIIAAVAMASARYL
ncbi:MAG: hypothetical protein Phog2KO_06960 [Phototrophicaceae bacterium]